MSNSDAGIRYFLWRAVLGSNKRIPLSPDEYRKLEDAWTRLTALLRFEEEWDVVLQNYIELELGFLSAALSDMVVSHANVNEIRRSRINLSRLVSNLLSACRSYLDHSPHHLGVLGPNWGESYIAKTNEAYDAEFGYRLMEALRNHAQHRGSPLHGASFGARRVERENDETFLQYSVGASVNVSNLREDEKFKKSVLSECSDNENIDLVAMSRVYVEKLGDIHAAMRKELFDLSGDARSALRAALDRHQAEAGESRIGISFAASHSDRIVDKYQTIPEDLIEWYESLVARNRSIINLRNRFVSSELLPERKGQLRRR